MLLVKDSRVLLQVRCHCTSGAHLYNDISPVTTPYQPTPVPLGLAGVSGRMWSEHYILSLTTVYAAVYDTL